MRHQQTPVARRDLQHTWIVNASQTGSVCCAEVYARGETDSRRDYFPIQVSVCLVAYLH
jgi:hypothetical protein